MTSESNRPRPRCRMCVHHYITHDTRFPYGCRLLGFKSAREPMRDVVDASGEICLYFVGKAPHVKKDGQ